MKKEHKDLYVDTLDSNAFFIYIIRSHSLLLLIYRVLNFEVLPFD